ncbi:hypothetical protein CFK37_14990 [Virgibacillus phasianinus]|uniref:Uncharacterized protein n=1 Tax=Virgibacillus phasianinus TaxID=2017483 RepID=A0A220U5J9_9BACI|nr:hypothetical protein [Virgibacillus phasianinus]ASK63370.1 hypothetical protein CFK37_14990 [Virgibacillus phasianinus]
MSIARKEIDFDGAGLERNGAVDSLQHVYDQIQMIDHVLDLQVDHAILDAFHHHNQQVNLVMKDKSRLLGTYMR